MVSPFEKYSNDLLEGTKLRYISLLFTTVSDFNLAYLKKRKIALTNAKEYVREPVAEQTIAMLLAIARNVPESIDFAKKGGYGIGSFKKGWDLKGKTIGIVGLGNIGSRVAELASSFDMNVIYYSKHQKKVPYKFVGINELLRASDVVSIHLSLSEETKNFIDDKKLKLLKPNAVLLNSAKGALVDFNAVYNKCKKSGIIFWFDQLEDRKWRKKLSLLKNVYITPENSTNTKEALENLQSEVLENLKSYFAGGRKGRVI